MFVSPPIEKRTTNWRCVLFVFYLSVCTAPSWSLQIPKATPSVKYGNTSSIKLFVSSNPVFAQINPRGRQVPPMFSSYVIVFECFLLSYLICLAFRLYLAFMRLFGTFLLLSRVLPVQPFVFTCFQINPDIIHTFLIYQFCFDLCTLLSICFDGFRFIQGVAKIADGGDNNAISTPSSIVIRFHLLLSMLLIYIKKHGCLLLLSKPYFVQNKNSLWYALFALYFQLLVF